MAPISFQELDRLGGEVLPERMLLSTVTSFGGGDGGGSSSSSSAAAAGGGGSVVVIDGGSGSILSACQTTSTPGDSSLLGDLGISGGSQAFNSQACTPAAISG